MPIDTSEWAFLVALIGRCSPEQLALVRAMITEEKEESAVAPTGATSERSMQWAREIWDEMKGAEDPAAAEVPDETMIRIGQFVRLCRNRTLDEISGMVDRAYTKFTGSVVESLKNLKE